MNINQIPKYVSLSVNKKLVIVLILLGLVALLCAFNRDFLKTSQEGYADLKMPEEVDYKFSYKAILSG